MNRDFEFNLAQGDIRINVLKNFSRMQIKFQKFNDLKYFLNSAEG